MFLPFVIVKQSSRMNPVDVLCEFSGTHLKDETGVKHF
jgi:hypothetical protein